jgi:YD repeat-containing protein
MILAMSCGIEALAASFASVSGVRVATGARDWNANGVIDAFEDFNGNGIPDAFEDFNGDGIPDAFEDFNGNGIPDAFEDFSGDGIPDAFEDFNGNGTPDAFEDFNGNGTPDAFEDFNGNGTPDAFEDFNGNGTPDAFEDFNGNGIPDAFEDFNGDGIPDAFEDFNGDGIPDVFEDFNGNGTPDAFEDFSGNGIPDAFESQLVDTIGTGVPDFFDVVHRQTLIPYYWIVQYGLHLFVDAYGDINRDGLSNYENYLHDLNPNLVDTHGGGTSDYYLVHGTRSLRHYYDRQDRIVGTASTDGFSFGYEYDGNGNLVSGAVAARRQRQWHPGYSGVHSWAGLDRQRPQPSMGRRSGRGRLVELAGDCGGHLAHGCHELAGIVEY